MNFLLWGSAMLQKNDFSLDDITRAFKEASHEADINADQRLKNMNNALMRIQFVVAMSANESDTTRAKVADEALSWLNSTAHNVAEIDGAFADKLDSQKFKNDLITNLDKAAQYVSQFVTPRPQAI
jgi:hypothetical protein